MEIIEPKVELWNETGPTIAAKAARICKASEKGNDEKLLEICKRDGHLSVFRHWSHYYIVPKNSKAGQHLANYMQDTKIYGENPYFTCILASYSRKSSYYISTNHQFVMEHENFANMFDRYEVSTSYFVENNKTIELVRFTFCITTSIRISRELNRTSPNAICEQSTRYVNFLSKQGDVPVCKSVVDNIDTEPIYKALKNTTDKYKKLIKDGYVPEEARKVLPLETATKVVYTYNIKEWKNIINLRALETTGKAAPDAKYIIGEVYNILKKIIGYDFMGV